VPFDMNLLTAAHKKLEFGTMVKVTNLSNQKQVITEINDRGPNSKTRILDLSKFAASKIGLIETGYAKVKIEIVGYKNMNSNTLIKHYNNIRMIKLGQIAKK
jgi:rare lipoprotein A